MGLSPSSLHINLLIFLYKIFHEHTENKVSKINENFSKMLLYYNMQILADQKEPDRQTVILSETQADNDKVI